MNRKPKSTRPPPAVRAYLRHRNNHLPRGICPHHYPAVYGAVCEPNSELYRQSVTYLSITLAAFVMNYTYMIATAILRGAGDTRTALKNNHNLQSPQISSAIIS